MLNQNQSVSILSMSKANDDVCYWQLLVDTDSFKLSHPALEISDLFVNVVVTASTNMVSYIAQG